MKKIQSLLLCLFLMAMFSACHKEKSQPETFPLSLTPTQEAEARASYKDLLRDNGWGGGVRFLPKEEYDKLPKFDVKDFTSLVKEKVAERGGYVKLPTPPVAYQGGEGSCTAFGTAYAIVSYYLNQLQGLPYQTNGALRSPEFLYNLTKSSSDCTKGVSYVPTVLNTLVQVGVCSWAEMPYSDSGCSTLPNGTQRSQAQRGKIAAWYTLYGADKAREALSYGYPVVIGFDADLAFKYQTKYSPYVWNASYPDTQFNGHVAAVVGYDDANQRFIVQNSWGTGIHDKGFFYLDYAHFNRVVREQYLLWPVR